MIELERVTKRFGGSAAVDDVSFFVERGEFFVLIGRSGSGKSTTLKMINRLVEKTSGAIRVGGEDVERLAPEALRRRIGYVIQSVGLFPHWTVEENIGTVPRLLGWPEVRVAARVRELLELLRLNAADYAGKYPHQLSGGQQQRVGVARALAADPDILLMDEPFGALDPITRGEMHAEFARIHDSTKKTILFVTHDMDEALMLADRLAVMESGRIVQAGSPREILDRPANAFVHKLIGMSQIGLKRLGVQRVADRMHPGEAVAGEPIAASATLRDALSRMVERRTERLPVSDDTGRVTGVIRLADLIA
jgi:osmoprotectant transport system ATP-binding protein